VWGGDKFSFAFERREEEEERREKKKTGEERERDLSRSLSFRPTHFPHPHI
jgi:hypothetical protein